jgi:sigma-E factor negative regulatory protein RseB
MNSKTKPSAISLYAAVAILLYANCALSAEAPADWLERMSAAVQKTSYSGTVIRTKGGEAEALKVVRSIAGGVISEKMTVQEGNGLEIIRSGDEVHCILPDKKSVLVESWNNQGTLFTTLPANTGRIGNEYDLSLVREDRVAGRKAVMLAIRPHDEFRFGHRLWLDRETAFPLRTEIIDSDGSLLEQVKFADINLASNISPEALLPSVNLDGFAYMSGAIRRVQVDVESNWVCDDLPPGFRVVSTKTEQIAGTEIPVTHILYSDGLATVSVFVAQGQTKKNARRTNVGGSSAYSLQVGDYQITAVGEVPAATVEKIASSMRRR